MKKSLFLLLAALLIQTPVWASSESPASVDGAITVTAHEAKALFDSEVLFVDVRKDSDWDAGRIPGAVHLDNKKGAFSESALGAEIDKAEKVVIYCNGPKCMRSSKGSAAAVAWGYTSVYYFRGGFPEWKAAGFPVE